MRGPPDARDIGSCRCVAQRRENGWGLIEEAPNNLPQCRRPSEIFAKLIEHVAVECGAGRDSLFLDRRCRPRFGCGGGPPRPAICGAPRPSCPPHRLLTAIVHAPPPTPFSVPLHS